MRKAKVRREKTKQKRHLEKTEGTELIDKLLGGRAVGSGLISCISDLMAWEMADDLQCSSVNGVRANSPFGFSPQKKKKAHQITSIVHCAKWVEIVTRIGQPWKDSHC